MRIHFFTVTELVVAMGVFGMLSLFTLRIFSGVQDAWTRSSMETETYETAQITMDMISEELKNIINPNEYDTTLDSGEKDQYVCFKLDSATEITYLTKVNGEVKFSGFKKDGTALYRKEYKLKNSENSENVDKYPFLYDISKTSVENTVLIAENVVSLKFSAYKKDYSEYTDTTNKKLPAYIIIELKLIDLPKLDEYTEGLSETSPLYLHHVHTYKRLIAINTTE